MAPSVPSPTAFETQVAQALEELKSPLPLAERLKTLCHAEEQARAELFTWYRGRAWESTELRPWVRARLQLSLALERAGKPRQGLKLLDELLKVSPDDPEELRHELLRMLLLHGSSKAALTLMRAYPQDEGTRFAWTRVLALVKLGEAKQALQALAEARALNPHVEGFLTARERQPRSLPKRWETGGPEEALHLLETGLGQPWTADRAAMAWLIKGGRE